MDCMRKVTFILFFSFLSATLLYAQKKISGTINDAETCKAVIDVYVMLMSDDGKSSLAYSFSDKNGAYSIDIPQNGETSFLISTSRLGYETFSKKITRNTAQLNIELYYCCV